MAFGARELKYTPPDADETPAPDKPRLHVVIDAEANAGKKKFTAADKSRERDMINADKRMAAENKRKEVMEDESLMRLVPSEEETAAAIRSSVLDTAAQTARDAEANVPAHIASARAKIQQMRADGSYDASKAQFEVKQATRPSNFENPDRLLLGKKKALRAELANDLQTSTTPGGELAAWDDMEEKTVASNRKNKTESTGVDRAVMLQTQLDELNSKTADLLNDEIKKMRFWVINKAAKAHKNLMDTNSVYAELVARREKITSNIGIIDSPSLRLRTTPEVSLSQPEPVAEQAPADTQAEAPTTSTAPEINTGTDAEFFGTKVKPSGEVKKADVFKPTAKFLTNAEKQVIAADKIMRPEDSNQARLIKLLTRLNESFGIDMDEQGKMGFFSQRKFNKLDKANRLGKPMNEEELAFNELVTKIDKARTALSSEIPSLMRAPEATATAARSGEKYNDIRSAGMTSGASGMKEK